MSFMWSWYAGRVTIEPVRRKRRRRSAARITFWISGLVLVACGVAAGAALLWWPHPRVEPDLEALAHVVQPGYAGHVSSVVVRRPDGSTIPVGVRQGRLWPEKRLVVGAPLTVELTVRRPRWVGWLVGRTARASLVLRTPSARLRGRWLEIRPGEPVVATFDTPGADGRAACARSRTDAAFRSSAHEGRRRRGRGRAAAGRKRLGQRGASCVGAAAEADSVELVPGSPPGAGARRARRPRASGSRPPDHAHLLPSGANDLRNEPADGHPARARPLAPARHPYALLPARRPRVPVGWSRGSPSPGTGGVGPGGRRGNTRTLAWEVRHGTILRLQQLLAQAGYLPLRWSPAADPVTTHGPHGARRHS